MIQSKTRRCSTCKAKVDAQNALTGSLKAFCSYQCLTSYTASKAGQKAVQSAIRKDTAERKERLKTRSDWKKEAQAAFNMYIRVRDSGTPCISCGVPVGENTIGGSADAGHYRSRGSSPHLSFNVFNCHSQCKKCNRYLSGSITDYRIGLVSKIGIHRVEMLESDNEPKKFDIEYLKRIKSIFSRKARLYKKLRREQ